jgi:hypothetical protein
MVIAVFTILIFQKNVRISNLRRMRGCNGAVQTFSGSIAFSFLLTAWRRTFPDWKGGD